MLYRVTFSNDVDEYYKNDAVDIQFTITVEASSLDNGILTAKRLLESYVFWPGIFEVVAIRAIDREFSKGDETPDLKTPEEWMKVTGIRILDPDGWRNNAKPTWFEPHTREEFIKKAMISTCYAWPKPLYDEDDDL